MSYTTYEDIKNEQDIAIKNKESRDNVLEKCKAIFTMLDVPVLNYWELVNKYHSDYTSFKPWYLFRTPGGLIRLGWRKRVIEIDWSDLEVRKIVTEDDVTKFDYMVHASYEKALEYVKPLKNALLGKERATQ